MHELRKSTNLYWPTILILVLILFRTAFSQFFSADDWFHLRISSIDSIQQFINFFSFYQSDQSAAFYRPLPTQVFFFFMQRLFGLEAFWWYCTVFVTFLACLYVIHTFIQHISDQKIARLTTLLYAVSHTNTTRLYFLSAYQEILLVLFSVISLYGFVNRSRKHWRLMSLFFFWLALLSKETAVVLPGLLGLLLLRETTIRKTKEILTLLGTYFAETWPFLLSLTIYLLLRMAVFGMTTAGHDSYQLSFQPFQVANTGMWYFLWAVGAPETLVNYVANFSVLERWWIDFPTHASLILYLLGSSLLGLAALVLPAIVRTIQRGRIKTKKTESDWFLAPFGASWFLLAVLPVLFFPNHKFALELGLPMVGFALGIATLVSKHLRTGWLLVTLLLTLNIASISVTTNTHYSILRSQTAKRVHQFFTTSYPSLPENTVVSFTNDRTDLPTNWGVSKQISESLQGSEFFAVLYPGKSVLAEYADLPHTVSTEAMKLTIGSAQFLP